MTKKTPYWLHILYFIFHPIFIPFYFFLLYSYLLPNQFKMLTKNEFFFRLVNVFLNTIFYPLFAVFLLYKLKFVTSIQLKTNKDRIIPIVINMFFYWWMFYLYRNFLEQNVFLKSFFLGIFFSSIIALISNSFYKISLHAMAMGTLFMAIILMYFQFTFFVPSWFFLSLFMTFLICYSRYKYNHHTKHEVVTGLLYAVFTQWLAYMISF